MEIEISILILKIMSTPIVELKNIHKSFARNKVLDSISLCIYPGEIIALVGENGCGKSTLIKIISGFYEYDQGVIKLNGKVYLNVTPSDSIKEGIQVIYQDFSLFPNLTVMENISLCIEIADNKKILNWRRMRSEAKKALDLIGINLDLDEYVSNLSVAEKQIVAISRAILQNAKLIIMDEPTTALTQREILRLYEIIRELCKKGVAVIFVSHKLDEVFNVCKRIIVVRNGMIVIDNPIIEFDREKLSYYMTGQYIAEEPFIYKKKKENIILEVKNISSGKEFYNISFNVKQGEILGITGQLGSGRTALAKALFGIIPIERGEIKIKGKLVELYSIKSAMKNKIAYLPEDRLIEGIFMFRSIKDNINSVILDDQVNKFKLLDRKKYDETADKWFKELSIKAPNIEVNAFTLSGGNQQRVVLGRWLSTKPEILILNCPTVGVDIKSKSEIHKIMKDLSEKDITIIIISDDIGELLNVTNRIIVMNNGRITYAVNTDETNYEEISNKITEIYETI